MPIPPVVALEIGTTKVLALVGEMREDGNVMITGIGEHPSAGVRKGEIIDLENAVVCVRSALERAEESGKVAIREVHLAASGGHIGSVVNRGAVPVLDTEGEITREDVNEVMEVARALNLSPDREILHTICQHFSVDGQEHVIQPEGMEGARLVLDMLVLHGVRTRLHNAVRVVRRVQVDVQDVAFGGLCSALSVLTPEQKRSGALVIDLGGGTTEYVAYARSVVAAAGVLGVGGDHITNDIALGFNIPLSRAESLKRDPGGAIVDTAAGTRRVSLPPEVGFPGCAVNVRSLQTVINARADEILEHIRKRVEDEDILHHLGAGIVLTGGGAHLRGITDLAQKVFGLPAMIGKPRGVAGLATATEGPEYATCSGLVQYGFRTATEGRGPSLLGSLWRGFFRR